PTRRSRSRSRSGRGRGTVAGRRARMALGSAAGGLARPTCVAWNRSAAPDWQPLHRCRQRTTMSVLRTLESKIAGLVEGTFSRAFRSEVRPVEIARRLAREMEEHKHLSVSRAYVPNQYRVYLSPSDRERFADYESALAAELAGYLLEHARRERLALLSRPVIEFETDDRLGLGEFGIQTGLVQPPPEPESAEPHDESGRTMIHSSADRVAEPLQERARSRVETALL